MKLLIFGAGMLVGGIISTVGLCCVMINNSRFDEQTEKEELPEPTQTETE